MTLTGRELATFVRCSFVPYYRLSCLHIHVTIGGSRELPRIVGAITHRLKRRTIQETLVRIILSPLPHRPTPSHARVRDSSASPSGNDFGTESRRRRTCDRFPKAIAVKWPRRALGDSGSHGGQYR